MKTIDISKSKRTSVKFIQIEDYRKVENKGWSYSSVYSLEEVRDMYILLSSIKYKNLRELTINEVIPKVQSRGKKWSERRVLEILNALVNFKWIEKLDHTSAYKVKETGPKFDKTSFGSELSEKDMTIFKQIFFSYSRFIEFISLYGCKTHSDLANATLRDSVALFSVRGNHKFTDTFFTEIENNTELRCINFTDDHGKKNTPCMMFWDVFISWAKSLQLIESFNSKMFDYSLSDGRSFSCSYFLSSDAIKPPSLPELLTMYFPGEKMVDTNQIVWKICTLYRKSIKEAKEYVISQYKKHKRGIGIVRSSEIFINKSDKRHDSDIGYPLYNGSYISHLIINKYKI